MNEEKEDKIPSILIERGQTHLKTDSEIAFKFFDSSIIESHPSQQTRYSLQDNKTIFKRGDRDSLPCGICQGEANLTNKCPHCRQLYCEKCVKLFIQDGKLCTNCENEWTITLSKYYSNMKVKCGFEGCKMIVNYSKLKRHENYCRYRPQKQKQKESQRGKPTQSEISKRNWVPIIISFLILGLFAYFVYFLIELLRNPKDYKKKPDRKWNKEYKFFNNGEEINSENFNKFNIRYMQYERKGNVLLTISSISLDRNYSRVEYIDVEDGSSIGRSEIIIGEPTGDLIMREDSFIIPTRSNNIIRITCFQLPLMRSSDIGNSESKTSMSKLWSREFQEIAGELLYISRKGRNIVYIGILDIETHSIQMHNLDLNTGEYIIIGKWVSSSYIAAMLEDSTQDDTYILVTHNSEILRLNTQGQGNITTLIPNSFAQENILIKHAVLPIAQESPNRIAISGIKEEVMEDYLILGIVDYISHELIYKIHIPAPFNIQTGIVLRYTENAEIVLGGLFNTDANNLKLYKIEGGGNGWERVKNVYHEKSLDIPYEGLFRKLKSGQGYILAHASQNEFSIIRMTNKLNIIWRRILNLEDTNARLVIPSRVMEISEEGEKYMLSGFYIHYISGEHVPFVMLIE